MLKSFWSMNRSRRLRSSASMPSKRVLVSLEPLTELQADVLLVLIDVAELGLEQRPPGAGQHASCANGHDDVGPS